jgi:hypothetical protein
MCLLYLVILSEVKDSVFVVVYSFQSDTHTVILL